MNNNNNKEIKLIERYIDGTATPQEQAAVEKWYNSISENDNEEITDEHKEKIYKKTVAALKNDFKGGKTIALYKWVRYAAAVLIIATGGYFLLPLLQNKKTQNIAHKQPSIQPGTNRATLQLNNGQIIYLDSIKEGAIAMQDNMQIIKLKNGEIIYKAINTDNNAPVSYNTITTPVGGQHQVHLPDGSKVTLNSISSIRFPTRFTGNERQVSTTGEVYFEVTKNKIPFVVDVTGKQKITVLGTEFNVNAYTDEAAIATTLIEGSVQLQQTGNNAPTRLRPGQQALLKSGIVNTHDNVDINHITAWKNGFFSFNHTPMSEIMRQVARWYGAKITIDKSVENETFTGRIPRNADIEKMLRIFEKTNVFNCEIKGTQIFILPRY